MEPSNNATKNGVLFTLHVQKFLNKRPNANKKYERIAGEPKAASIANNWLKDVHVEEFTH